MSSWYIIILLEILCLDCWMHGHVYVCMHDAFFVCIMHTGPSFFITAMSSILTSQGISTLRVYVMFLILFLCPSQFLNYRKFKYSNREQKQEIPPLLLLHGGNFLLMLDPVTFPIIIPSICPSKQPSLSWLVLGLSSMFILLMLFILTPLL